MTSPVESAAQASPLADASERAYTALLTRISGGEITAGERLLEQSLAAQLGVSRTPVRDAIKRLAAEGLVDIQPHRGAQVVSFSPEDVAALYTMRAEFEPLACRLAVPTMSDDDVARLDRLAREMEQVVEDGDDPGALTSLNNAFHAVFVEGSGNRHLAIALQAVLRPAVVSRTFRQYDARALARSMRHHAELVEAAAVRDGEWAEAVMRAHILSARHVTEEAAAESDGSGDGPLQR